MVRGSRLPGCDPRGSLHVCRIAPGRLKSACCDLAKENSVLRMARMFSLIPVVIAVLFLAAPGAALPCFAPDCGQARSAVQPAGENPRCSCCAGEAPESPKPDEDSRSPHDGHPCDCPPGCPAPCGLGKLPCPPVDPIRTSVEMAPAGILLGPTRISPSDIPVDAVFHPPRV
jgi:hypothetical protein